MAGSGRRIPRAIARAAVVAALAMMTSAGAPTARASASPASAWTSASADAVPLAAAAAVGGASDPGLSGWRWPVAPLRVVAPFVAPAHEYGPGHRGIDLAAAFGAPVAAPAPGVVAFVGSVAGRGVVTIDHGDGLVTTLEPVNGSVAIGDAVSAGDVVGTVDAGGHTEAGAVHFGVRRHGAYINPMLLLGEVPRAVLLPCC